MMENTSERGLTAADEEAIAAFMRELSSLPVSLPGAPPPEVLWLKAQLTRRWEAERRAQAPLDVMDVLELAGGLVAAGVLFAWSAPALLRVVSATMDVLR
jgi:hypothetical protein